MLVGNLKGLPSNAKRFLLAFAIAIAGVGTWFGWQLSNALATPPPATPTAPAAPVAASPAAADANPTLMPTTVQIVFTTVPPARANVRWGKTLLGQITPHAPLVVVRPRDSGPLDVTVSAPGFLSVHTRAHTFADTKVAVKLTRPDQKATLFGYRAPIDAGMPDESLSPSTGIDLQQPPP